MTTPERPRIPREIVVLVAAAFCVAIGYGLVAPVLPQYARSFDVGVQAASLIVSAFAFMRLVFAPVGGALVARLGERSVYLTGLLVVALSTGACAFATSYGQLLTFRALGGIGSTMFTVSAAGLIVRLAPPSIRGRVSSAYASAFLLGNIAGPVLGGLVAGFGYRVPFIVYAVSLLAAAAVVAAFLSGASLRPPPGAPTLPAMTVREALTHPAYRAAMVSAFGVGWGNFGVRGALLPLLAASLPGVDVAWAGVALTVFALGTAVSLAPAGRAVDRYGRRPLMLTGMVVTGLATGVLGFAASVIPLLLLSFVGGLGSGLVSPAQQAALADIVGRDHNGGKVLAAFQMAQDCGAILGPVVAGAIADAAGFGWAFAVTGVVVLAGLPGWLRAPETLPRAAGR